MQQPLPSGRRQTLRTQEPEKGKHLNRLQILRVTQDPLPVLEIILISGFKGQFPNLQKTAW
jgi:hypothetical protein